MSPPFSPLAHVPSDILRWCWATTTPRGQGDPALYIESGSTRELENSDLIICNGAAAEPGYVWGLAVQSPAMASSSATLDLTVYADGLAIPQDPADNEAAPAKRLESRE